MYNKWFASKELTLGPLSRMRFLSLTKCEFDILRFIAENGPHSMYDARELGYKYPYIHKNAKKLANNGFIKFEKDTSGPRTKKLIKITFTGFLVFILAWKEYGKEAKMSIKTAMAKHQDYFPFYKIWNEITNVVGEEEAFKKLIEVAKQTIGGSFYEIKMDGLDFKFKAFLDPSLESKMLAHQLFFPDVIKKKRRNPEISKLIASDTELKNNYVAHLAIEDIISLSEGHSTVNETEKLESEKELAKLEQREIKEKQLFTADKLRELFPTYANKRNVFTSLLMFKLLWETLEPTESVREKPKTGFHVYPLKE